MCGIAGIVSIDGQVPDDQVASMLTPLSHRGPDNQGSLRHGNVVLTHTRLSLVEIGRFGDQPMSTPDNRFHLVYNGEVFNHQEIRQTLLPVDYRGRSDTETLLHGLAQQGSVLLSELNGFFAFAFYDTAKREILLCRDRFGVKPLYYAEWNGRFIFASEIKAILATGFPRQLDEQVFRHTLVRTWTQGERTPLQGIRRLLPGELLRVSVDNLAIRRERWFNLAHLVDAEYAAELEQASHAEVKALLRSHLERAVERRLEADVPVGLLCSGGLDSSLLTALATRRKPGVRAYHAETFGRWNERPYAQAVTDHVGATLVPVPITADAWRRKFIESAAHFEYPLWHESSIPLALIAEAARADGVAALIGGEAADEMFGGYDYKHKTEREAFAALCGQPVSSPIGRREDWVVDHAFHPLNDVDGGFMTDLEYQQLVAKDLQTAFTHHAGPRADLEAALTAELQLFLIPSLTRIDKNLMQGSVEYREPFLDIDVVRLATNLPLEWKVKPAVKSILRDVAAEFLPSQILDRPKLGFSFDPSTYFEGQTQPDFLEKGYLREALGVDRTQWIEFVRSSRGRGLFRLYGAEIWYRLFVMCSTTTRVTWELWRHLPAAS